MNLLITIVSGMSILFGIGLFFSPARGSLIASIILIGAGVIAYDEKAFTPLLVGFGLLWLLRIFGIEER